MVIVNTAVIVHDELQGTDRAVAFALAAFGAGSMILAFLLPRILKRRTERFVMIGAGMVMTLVLTILASAWPMLAQSARWPILLSAWPILGAAYASLVTPGGRLLRRSSNEADRPALFAAQFSQSHACWLIAYPLGGWLGVKVNMSSALWAMAALAVLGVMAARSAWPVEDQDVVLHRHDELPADHPHLQARASDGRWHAHHFVIDDLHTQWPA